LEHDPGDLGQPCGDDHFLPGIAVGEAAVQDVPAGGVWSRAQRVAEFEGYASGDPAWKDSFSWVSCSRLGELTRQVPFETARVRLS
jgi:hypothetical protein